MHAVIGATGLVGHYVLDALRARDLAHLATARRTGGSYFPLELADPPAVERFIDAHELHAVYFCGAQSNVDAVERDPHAARIVNVEAPLAAVRALRRSGIPIVLFSSDYVFDGADGPYADRAQPAPLNAYGRQKLELEQLALVEPHVLVLRITHVFGREPEAKNFGMRCVETLRRNQPLVVPADQYATPTHAATVADAAVELVERGARGLFNVASPTVVSRAEWARMLAESFGLDDSLIEAKPTAQLGQAARRPLRAGLRSERAEAMLGRHFPPLADSIARFHAEMTAG